MPLQRVHIIEHEAAFTRLVNGSGVARDLTRRAINVQNQAKRNASGRPGPNVDTGRLRSSITFELRERSGPEGTMVARVGTNVEYALPLEKGLRNGVTYPFLGPALKAARG